MATQDHPKHHLLGVHLNTPSGLAPSILCTLAHSHGLLALPGCLKWTILPQTKAYFRKLQIIFHHQDKEYQQNESRQLFTPHPLPGTDFLPDFQFLSR